MLSIQRQTTDFYAHYGSLSPIHKLRGYRFQPYQKGHLAQEIIKNIWWLTLIELSLQAKRTNNMAYTKETLVISNPSEKLLKAVERLRVHKRTQLEKLRNMKSEEFSRRVILS